MAFHERLRERLAGFELRGRGGWSEEQPPSGGEPVRDPETQGQFGTDDGEIDGFANRKREKGVDISDIRTDGACNAGDSRVSGSTEDEVCFTLSNQPRYDRVLARAATDDQNSHYLNDLERATGCTRMRETRDYLIDLGQECGLESALAVIA
jgi:hypothetical protein